MIIETLLCETLLLIASFFGKIWWEKYCLEIVETTAPFYSNI